MVKMINNKMSEFQQMLFSKKTLYTLCFIAINIIELLRASMTGDIWYVAVNCTGLVMMIVVFSAYPIKDFLDLWNGVYTLLCIFSMILVGVLWVPTGDYVLWQIETALMNVWWIGIVARYLFQKVIVQKTIAFKPGITGWLWIAMSILMIISVNENWWPLWFLLMFGAFYLTPYKEGDRRILWNAMLDGTLISFFCIQSYAYGFRPYDEVRYKGAFGNCNMAALYYLIVYLMCLLKLHLLEHKKSKKVWKLFYLIGAGGMLSFQLFTMCRTAWITSFIFTVLYGFLVIRKIWKKTWRQVFYRGCALVLALVFTFLPVYYTMRWLPTILHHPVWYEGEYSIKKVHSFDPPDSEKYVELDEFLSELFGRIQKSIGKAASIDPFVLHVNASAEEYKRVPLEDIPGLDESLKIRMTIFKAYINDLNLFGHRSEDGFYYIGTSEYHSWHAQNLWLQMAFCYGIPTGILSIILTIAILIQQKRKMDHMENVYAVFPFLVCVVVFLFGTMEVVWNSGQLIMFLFFFVQHPKLGTESIDKPLNVEQIP